MLTIKVWEKNWNLANTFWQILKRIMEDTESPTLPGHPSTYLCSSINWIMYSKNWNVLPKLTLHLDSFWKIFRLECVYILTLTKTTIYWKELNFCVHKLIWLTWKTECKKWILLINVPEREPLQSGSLLKDAPMGCKDTVFPEPLLKNHNVNCLTFERNTRQPYTDNLCLFRALALHFHGNQKLEEETSKIFNIFLSNSEEGDVSEFQGAHLNDIPKVEDLLQINIFFDDIGFVDGILIGEPCRISTQKYESSVKLLRYNNHICYVNNINALLKAFRYTTCDTIFSKTGNLERHLVICSDRLKNIYSKYVYELTKTLLEKLDAFNISYRNEQKVFKNLAIFDFESICVKDDSFKQTETTTWIGKHLPTSVSVSSNLIPEPILRRNANLHRLISSFIIAVEGLGTQSKTQMKLNFIEVETAIKIKLSPLLEQLNQRRNREERVSNFVNVCIVEEERDLSTQFLQMRKNQLIDLQEHFEHYCNVLPASGFNSAKYDINLIKWQCVTNSCKLASYWTESYEKSQSVGFLQVWRLLITWHYEIPR